MICWRRHFDHDWNPQMSIRRIVLPMAFLVACTLAGCGFHPRAELAVPADLGPVKVISSDPYSPLADSLASALSRAHVQPATPLETQTASLRIASETFTERPLTVDAFSQVREFVIMYTVKYAFVAADGTDIVPLRDVRLQRDYSYDASHALGSSEEQDTIHRELQRDMAASIIRSIGIALRNYKH